MRDPLYQKITQFPEGYSTGEFRGKRYGISRQTFNEGKSEKVYAEELGGTDFISLNYYLTSSKDLLHPCEMPASKVREFLNEVRLLDE